MDHTVDPTMYRVLADVTLVVHAAFVAFVLAGGVLAGRWRWMAWLHVPAVMWAVGIEWSGGVCPLTPLENWLRARAGLVTYDGDFLGRYLYPVLYPAGLTRRWQVGLGVVALVWNGAVYAVWWWQAPGRRGTPTGETRL